MLYPPDLIKALLLLMFASIVAMSVPDIEAATRQDLIVSKEIKCG
jgi:hypothetical protein